MLPSSRVAGVKPAARSSMPSTSTTSAVTWSTLDAVVSMLLLTVAAGKAGERRAPG
jgi:hypothetical protein